MCWVEKAVEWGILKLLKRVEFCDGKGAKRDERAWDEMYNWGNNSKQEEKELFLKKWRWGGMRQSREQLYYCTSRQGWRAHIWWLNFFYRVPGKLMCWEIWRREARGCPRTLRRLWNSSCERMGADKVVLCDEDYRVALKLLNLGSQDFMVEPVSWWLFLSVVLCG